MNEKLRVGILGGTGMVGQRFISLMEKVIAVYREYLNEKGDKE